MSKNWYILHTYTGYEGKIERTIKSLIEKFSAGDKTGIDPEVVIDVKVPVEVAADAVDADVGAASRIPAPSFRRQTIFRHNPMFSQFYLPIIDSPTALMAPIGSSFFQLAFLCLKPWKISS